MSKKLILTLSLIFIISILVRFLFIDHFPPSLNWDEVSIGYNASSILKTARDQWGAFLPTIFRTYGDYKLPLYIYGTIPFIAIFGLSPLSLRFLSILSGSILPILFFIISKYLFPKNKYLPIISAIIIALTPWSIFLSRIALEANLFLALFCLSLYFLFKKKFNLSLLVFSLCLFTYNSARVLLPFYLLGFYFNRPIKVKPIALIIFASFIGLFIYQTFFSFTGQSRYKLVSLIDEGTINRIESRRATLSPLLGKIIHNKATYFITYSAINYLKLIDPRFMFFSGSSNYQYNIPNYPLIYPIFLPFFLLGFIFLVKNRHQLIYWFLISPIPSAITRDAPHTLRAITLLPITIIIIAYGLSKFKFRFLLPTLSLVVIILTFVFFKNYQAYCQKYSWSWQYGYQQAVAFTKTNYQNYNHIYFTKKYGEPHEFILFYWPWDPNKYLNDPSKSWNFHSDWYWVDAFDKFTFLNDWEVKEKTNSVLPNSLLITSPNNYPNNAVKLKTIYFLDNSPAFDIVKL